MSVRLPVPIQASPPAPAPQPRGASEAVIPQDGADPQRVQAFQLAREINPALGHGERPFTDRASDRPTQRGIGQSHDQATASRPTLAADRAVRALPPPQPTYNPAFQNAGSGDAPFPSLSASQRQEGHRAYQLALQERPSPRILDIEI